MSIAHQDLSMVPDDDIMAPKTLEHVAPAPHIWEDWQTDILERYLPDYKTKKTRGARVAIMGKVLQKFKGRMVCGDGDVANLRKAVQQWFTVKSRMRKPKQVKIRSMNWNFRTVAAVEKKAEIKEAQQILAGNGEIKFGSFQAGLNFVLSKMEEKEIEELKATAKKWNSIGPPEEEKQRLAVKSAVKFCRTFAEKAWKQLGGRVYIFWGCRDRDGTLSASKFDFNAELGDGRSYRDIISENTLSDQSWGKYLQQCYDGNESHGDQDILMGGNRGSPMDLDSQENGEPILPLPETWPADVKGEMLIRWLKKLLRSFLGLHYSLATGGRTCRVPWADIVKDTASFIDAEYLPDLETLDAEPSHLAIHKVKKLLNFWIERQKAGMTVFRFRLVIQGSERVAAKQPDIRTNTHAPTIKSAKGKRRAKGQLGTQPMEVPSSDDDEDHGLKQKKIKQKAKAKPKGKKTVISSEQPGASGEEFDFQALDDFDFSDDNIVVEKRPKGSKESDHLFIHSFVNLSERSQGNPSNSSRLVVDSRNGPMPITPVVRENGMKTNTPSESIVTLRPAPQILVDGEKDLWKSFNEKLPVECRNWSEEQAIAQFRVFQSWSSEVMGREKDMSAAEIDQPKVGDRIRTVPVDHNEILRYADEPNLEQDNQSNNAMNKKDHSANIEGPRMTNDSSGSPGKSTSTLEERPNLRKRMRGPLVVEEGEDGQKDSEHPAKKTRAGTKVSRDTIRTNAPGPSRPLTRSKAKRGGKRK